MQYFQTIWDNVTKETAALFRTEFSFNPIKAKESAQQMLEEHRAEIQEWREAIRSGKATQDDFEWAMQAKLDQAAIAKLTVLGLTKIKRDRLVNGAIHIIISNILKIP